jgi:metal-responsive CopG/Arc/MetJ family transcriptional regulator
MTYPRITICVEPEVFQALETLRGTKTQFRSEFINELLREKLGLKKGSL